MTVAESGLAPILDLPVFDNGIGRACQPLGDGEEFTSSVLILDNQTFPDVFQCDSAQS